MNIKNFTRKKLVSLLIVLISITSLHGQSYLNVLTETTVGLTQTNITGLDYLSVTTANWSAERTYCDVTGIFYNMSSADRHLNIDVNNVASFDLYVFNSTVGRLFKVTVGSGTEQTITHGGASCEFFSFSTGGNSGDLRIKIEGGGSSVYPAKIVLYPATAVESPIVVLFSGDNPAAANETIEMTPVVYTYANVANDDNVLLNWYTDNTYTTTTTAPGGLSVAKDTDAKTVTISGTPTTIGNYYYKIGINEVEGNEIEGLIVVVEKPSCNDLRLASDFTSGIASYAFASGDILHGVDVNGISVNLPNRNTSLICGGADYRIQLTYVVLEVKSTNVNSLTVIGTSSSSAIRNISKLEIGNSFSESYTEITDFNEVSNTIDGSCGELTIDNLDIPVNSFLRFTFSGNVNLSGFDLCYNPATPTISLTSGNNPASAVATVEMTPVVYTYSDVADDANVLFDWYTDNTYASSTSAPAGLSISKDTEENTVTVSGTPTTVGTYYYKVVVDETDGNAIEGSVEVGPYVISNVENLSLKAIYFDGMTIRNTNQEVIRVLDMSGRIIKTSNKDIDMSAFNRGIYIIRGETGVMKIAL